VVLLEQLHVLVDVVDGVCLSLEDCGHVHGGQLFHLGDLGRHLEHRCLEHRAFAEPRGEKVSLRCVHVQVGLWVLELVVYIFTELLHLRHPGPDARDLVVLLAEETLNGSAEVGKLFFS